MKKRVSSVSLLILLLLSGTGGLVADPLPDTLERIKPSIVAVGTVEQTRRAPVKFMGTGFAVVDGSYVVTNAHVLPKKLNEKRKESLAVFTGEYTKDTIRLAVKVAEDKDHDIAILKIAGASLKPLVLDASTKVREGESYAFTGFPIGSVLGLRTVTHKGMISAITPIVIPADSASQIDPIMLKRMRQAYDLYQLDAIAYPGNSGSPLYNPRTGKVIGVINSVFIKQTKEKVLSDPSGITYAIPVKYIKDLLNRKGRNN